MMEVAPPSAPPRAVTEATGQNVDRRTSLVGACATLYSLTLRQHLHGKRWTVLVALFLLPAGLAVIIRATASEAPSSLLDFVLLWILIPQALLPLVALLYASGIIQDEQEEQTITYLLVRPIPKWLIYLVKMLATWTTTVLLVVVLTLLTFLAIYWKSGVDFGDIWLRCLRVCGIHSLAVVVYCSLFGLIGLLTKRTLIVGVLYTAIIEGVLANLPLSLRMVTVIYYARLIAYRTMDFVVTWPGGRSDDVAASAWSFDTRADPGLAEHPQLKTCVFVLLIAALAFTIIAAWLCSGREFHVKTPEKE
jgi:ABC-2 type transport system permease protein